MSKMILITNDFFPDMTTNARLLSDVVTEFSKNCGDVEIFCSKPRKEIVENNFFSKSSFNVNIKRFWSPNLKKSQVIGRLINSFFVCVGIFITLVFFRRKTLILVDTTSPFQGPITWISSKIRKHKYIYLATEFYPDAAIALGFLKKNSLVNYLWEYSNRRVYSSASYVIVIGERLRNNVARYFEDGINESNLVVIHNWADTEKINPIKPKENYFRKDLGLSEKIVILYSGNLGLSHDLSTLIKAADNLRKDEKIIFLIIGEGPQKIIIESEIKKLNLSNIILMPYQSEDVLPYSLSSGDFSVVTLNQSMDKLTVPSKLYPAMAAGQAIIALFSEETDISDIVKENNAGIVVEQGDYENFAREISRLSNNKVLLNTMKDNSRKTVKEKYSKDLCVGRYIELLESVMIENN